MSNATKSVVDLSVNEKIILDTSKVYFDNAYLLSSFSIKMTVTHFSTVTFVKLAAKHKTAAEVTDSSTAL